VSIVETRSASAAPAATIEREAAAALSGRPNTGAETNRPPPSACSEFPGHVDADRTHRNVDPIGIEGRQEFLGLKYHGLHRRVVGKHCDDDIGLASIAYHLGHKGPF
jgi:hypothetical protein